MGFESAVLGIAPKAVFLQGIRRKQDLGGMFTLVTLSAT
jgi:hypothetical protein